MFVLDDISIKETARKLREFPLELDSYTNPEFYPPIDMERELQLAYFAFMVAIDHRTSTPISIFEGVVDGKKYHGADLLYRLGMKLFMENPELFYAENLAKVGPDQIKTILMHDGHILWDYNVRTFLIRDLGQKVVEYYSGEFTNLFSVDKIADFADRLKMFRAYEDPVMKKTYLLAKFLYGRKLVLFRDKENFEVAVDNHLTRIALRLGIVRLDNYKKIEKQIEFTRDEDIALRKAIKKAWKKVSVESGKDPFQLDDFLWNFGRKICTRESPQCVICPFKDVCLARKKGVFWWEHRFTLTWYY